MSKEELIEFEGLVTEILPDARYRIQLDTGHVIVAYTAGKMKKNRIKTLAGDRVTVEMSPYDLDKGRLIEVEKRVALRGGCRSACGGRFGAFGGLWRDDRCGGGGGPADDGALQEIAPAESRIGHERLPAPRIEHRGRAPEGCSFQGASASAISPFLQCASE